MESLVSDEHRTINASVFRAWWERLSELFARHPDDQALGKLLRRLSDAGRDSGATYYHVPDGASAPKPHSPPTVLNPAFDWQNGAIDFGSTIVDGWKIGADQSIAELGLATGIPAHAHPARL
jgi:hypothetical protein